MVLEVVIVVLMVKFIELEEVSFIDLLMGLCNCCFFDC